MNILKDWAHLDLSFSLCSFYALSSADCNNVAITLATLSLDLGDLDESGFEQLEDSLEEGEISKSVDDIRENFQNVLETVDDKCEDVDFIGFVDFEEEDFTK